MNLKINKVEESESSRVSCALFKQKNQKREQKLVNASFDKLDLLSNVSSLILVLT